MLRHRLSVLQRQLGPDRVRFTTGDRALLAALLHRIPRDVLKRLYLVVAGNRAPLAPRCGRAPAPPAVRLRRPGRSRTVRSIRILVLRLVRENPGWGIAGLWRAAGVRGKSCRFHRLGDPAPGRDRPGARARSHHVGRFPAVPGRGPAGLGLLRGGHPIRGAAARVRGDRARQPANQDSGRRWPFDGVLGGAGRQGPRDGPGGCPLPGSVPDQGPGREVPGLSGVIVAAMDWLASRQDAIEARLAARHLAPAANPSKMALFDLSSSWLEGSRCPLAARGYSRDGRKSKLQIECGLLTDPAVPCQNPVCGLDLLLYARRSCSSASSTCSWSGCSAG